jgi:ubiquinone/menaquinone biosynthesis C-methylase UbiE
MLQNSFDIYAHHYERVYHFLNNHLNQVKTVLEINCGTGEDAKWFAEKGFTVHASDISKGMIEVCKQKEIKHANFSVCDTRNIHVYYKPQSIDLLFSNFGGLNCLNPAELSQFLENSASLLKPNGLIAVVIMGRKCFWERMYFKLKKDNRLNRRLSKTGVDTIINNEHFLTHYYSPEEFFSLGKTHFSLVCYKPIGFFVPPSYFNSYFRQKKVLLSILHIFEKLSPFSFLANSADHYLIVLKKNS